MKKGMFNLRDFTYRIHHTPTNEELVKLNESFWEHFTDHLQSALAFLLLGFLLAIVFIAYLHKHKLKIDYELDKGTIMRVYHNGKKWLIVNPSTTMEWFDVVLLTFFDKRGCDLKHIDKQDKKRVRKIGIIILFLFFITIIWGVIMLFSASQVDVNPFNWLRGYRPWK